MSLARTLHQSRKGVLGTLILAPVLYAVFALVRPTPAFADSECVGAELASCSFDQTSCYEESGGVGTCCTVCYNYSCRDGSIESHCFIECGVQC